jgi:transcriptional regulator with XRE-family HTH domain
MGCSQQYVSNLLKGSSNMTLETVARLENALDIDIFKTALTIGHNHAIPIGSHRQYLSEPEGPDYGGKDK